MWKENLQKFEQAVVEFTLFVNICGSHKSMVEN